MSDLTDAFGNENYYLSESERIYIQTVRNDYWQTMRTQAPAALLNVLTGDSFRKLKDINVTKECFLFVIQVIKQQLINKSDFILGLRVNAGGTLKMICLESLVWLQCVKGILHLVLIAHAGMGYADTLPNLMNKLLDDVELNYIYGRHGLLGIIDACPWASGLDVQRFLITGEAPEYLKQMKCVDFENEIVTSWNKSYCAFCVCLVFFFGVFFLGCLVFWFFLFLCFIYFFFLIDTVPFCVVITVVTKGLPSLWIRADVWLLIWSDNDIFGLLFEKSVGDRLMKVLSTFPNESWIVRDKNHAFRAAYLVNEVCEFFFVNFIL